MKQQKAKTRLVKLFNDVIEVKADQKPIRMCNRKCTILGDKVFSYDTEVAKIDWDSNTLFVPIRSFGYSMTTTRQLNKVAEKYELKFFANRPTRVKKDEYTHTYSP